MGNSEALKQLQKALKKSEYIIKRQHDEIRRLTQECKSLKDELDSQKCYIKRLETKIGAKCGTCIYSKPVKWGSRPSGAYVECTNEDHLKQYCSNHESAKVRQRTAPGCRRYKSKEDNDNGRA